MTTLRRKARLVLEGSERSEGATEAVAAYIHDLLDRTLLEITNVELSIEVRSLLQMIADLADPYGETDYRIEIVQRKATGRPPNPLSKRYRRNNALFAAYYADRMLAEDAQMQKKAANSKAAEAFEVTVPEIYAARKTEHYKILIGQSVEKP